MSKTLGDFMEATMAWHSRRALAGLFLAAAVLTTSMMVLPAFVPDRVSGLVGLVALGLLFALGAAVLVGDALRSARQPFGARLRQTVSCVVAYSAAVVVGLMAFWLMARSILSSATIAGSVVHFEYPLSSVLGSAVGFVAVVFLAWLVILGITHKRRPRAPVQGAQTAWPVQPDLP